MAKYSHRGQVIVPMVCIAASQQSREKYAPFTSLLCQPCHLVISPTRHVGTWYGCELSRGKFPHVSTCRRVGYANLHFVLSAVSHIVEDPTQPHTAFSGAHIVVLVHSLSSPLNTVHGSRLVFVCCLRGVPTTTRSTFHR